MRKIFAMSVTALALAACAAVVTTAGADVKRLPDVVTGKAGHAKGITVLMEGLVNPEGSPTIYYFQYGPTINYGRTTGKGNAGSGIKPIKVGLTGALLPGYHFRLVAANQFGTRVGKDREYAPKTTKLKFETPKSFSTLWGHVVIVSGRLIGPGAAHHRVALDATPYPYREAFEEIGNPTITNASGGFSFRLGVLRTSYLLRVFTLDALPKFSHPFKELITARVSFSVRTSSKFGFVRMFGKVTPSLVGARVTFQYLKAVRPGITERTENRTSKFVTTASTKTKRATKRFSYFSFVFSVRHGGVYRAVVTPHSGGVAGGVSRTLSVRGPAKRQKGP